MDTDLRPRRAPAPPPPRTRLRGLGPWHALLLCLTLLAAPAELRAEGDPAAEAARYFGLGNAAYDGGNFAEAERMFRVCIALSPDLAGPYRRLGQTLRVQGRCEEAIDAYLGYLERKPEGKFSDEIRGELAECTTEVQEGGKDVTLGAVATASLDIEVEPAGATLRVDGLPMGEAPLKGLKVKAGVHRIQASHPEHLDGLQTVDLAGGERRSLTLRLEPRPAEVVRPAEPAAATLHLDVVPSGARVSVDDALVGLAPVPPLVLPPGAHSLRVVKPGFLSDVRTLDLAPGESRSLELRLLRLGDGAPQGEDLRPSVPAPSPTQPPPPPRARPWLVWLGGSAAFLGAGTVLGIKALVSAQSYADGGPASDRRELKDDGETEALAADLLLGTGAALAVTGGLVWWFSQGEEPDSGGAAVQLAPVLGPQGVGMTGVWQW